MSINKLLIGVLLAVPVTTEVSASSWVGYLAGKIKISDFCRGQNCPNMPDKKQIEAQGQKWLDALPKAGFKLQNTNETATYQDETTESGYRFITISAYGGDWRTTLFFSRPISSAMSVKEIQDRVQSFASEGFPTPGLKHPNWKIRALTPSSHVKDGIQILSVGPGFLKFKVRTDFFSLHGYDNRMPKLQDVATPPEAYFSIEKKYWAEAEITYKIKNFE